MVTRVKNLSGRRAYIALGVVLASVASVALAATFNLFQPAAGILKGNPSTYVTTAAASSDVISLWTGTCNGSSALKGDGSCGTLAAGTVSSVGLTMPTGFSVSGSPVTTTGTLGVTTTLNGPVRGNGSGLITGNTALGSEVSGLLPVANGGIGVGTLSGIAKGNGTSAFTSAVASDVYGLWAGGCSSSNFLRGDGTCASPGGGGTVTSVAAGTGISASPSPIISTGTISTDPNYLTSVTTTAQVAKGTSFTALQYGNATSNPTHTFLGTGHMVVNSNLVDVNALQALSVSAGSVDAPAITVSGTNVCQASGTNCPAFASAANTSAAVNLDNCTVATPTTFQFARAGKVATFSANSTSCTALTTIGTIGWTSVIPVGYRPTTNVQCLTVGLAGSSQSTLITLVFLAGNSSISASVYPTTGPSFTAGQTQSIQTLTCSYPIP